MNDVTFTELYPDGTTANVQILKGSWIAKCPHFIMSLTHYKEDGTCLCFDKGYQNKLRIERHNRREKLLATQRKGRI